MSFTKFELDRRGIREILQSEEMQAAINDTADQIAAAATQELHDSNIPVTVEHYTTDRGAAAITIAHPSGLAQQAKHGILTKAAGSVGLEVAEK